MDFKYTPEQEALKKEFEDFFKEEMEKAPPDWASNLETLYGQWSQLAEQVTED